MMHFSVGQDPFGIRNSEMGREMDAWAMAVDDWRRSRPKLVSLII